MPKASIPQIHALLLFLLVWLADAAVDDGPVKLLVFLFAGALIRYTYGLNLPDLALAIAIVLLSSRSSCRSLPRALLAFAGAAAFVVVGWRAVVLIPRVLLEVGPPSFPTT